MEAEAALRCRLFSSSLVLHQQRQREHGLVLAENLDCCSVWQAEQRQDSSLEAASLREGQDQGCGFIRCDLKSRHILSCPPPPRTLRHV